MTSPSAKLRVTVAELRKRLDIGPDFSLLKFHTASPKISFLAYPDFDQDPHPALAEPIIVDLVTDKIRRQFSLATCHRPCFTSRMPRSAKTSSPRPALRGTVDFQAEARELGAYVAELIRKGEAKEFLVKHGFVTRGGKLTKRYGG